MKEKTDRNDLDLLLGSDAQNDVRHVVRSLPEDEPSLAWRSELNLRLMAVSKHGERRRRQLVWKSLAGAMAALTLGVIGLTHFPSQHPVRHTSNGSIEASILASHRRSVAYRDLNVVGPGTEDSDTQWDDTDLGTQ
jgi:hypothetical protein